MKAFSKVTFVLLILLMAISALSVVIVSAQSATLDIDVSVSSTNQGVREDASYTLTITNRGSANVSSANITAFDFHNIRNLIVNPSDWNITNQVVPSFGSFILISALNQGLAPGQTLTLTFDATNPQTAGLYHWNIGISESKGPDGLASPEHNVTVGETRIKIVSLLPTLAILGIAAGIAFLNSGVNRVLINHFVGWEQYHVMQKEMNEHRAETMAAMRANDKKQIEKLKKKDSQIKNMQAKMMKPQMLQIGISFVYLLVWFVVLTPTFGNTSLAYLPGFGPISVFYLYPVFSFFLGFLSSRVIGIMPITPR
jgi:uncharacterized membrane protein (DUF106 family)